MSKTVKQLLAQKDWHGERKRLREILLDCGLDEAVKWNKLCYTAPDSNIAIIYGFADSCAVGFFKGALLDDPENVLESPGKSSQAMRRLHFESKDEIDRRESTLRDFVEQAIANEQEGREVEFDGSGDPDPPSELLDKFDRDAEFKKAYAALTPGRQRGYLLHFADAKKSETRFRRIEKHQNAIRSGKGLHDR